MSDDPRRRKTLTSVCNYCYVSTPEMQRKLDEPVADWMKRYRGTGTDPKNRKRTCPHCSGAGQREYCYVCGEVMAPVCGGRPSGLYSPSEFPACLRAGRSDRRSHEVILGTMMRGGSVTAKESAPKIASMTDVHLCGRQVNSSCIYACGGAQVGANDPTGRSQPLLTAVLKKVTCAWCLQAAGRAAEGSQAPEVR